MEFSTQPVNVPEVTMIYSPPGVGKTELAANFPNPVFLMVGLETGLLTLIKHGRVRSGIAKNAAPIDTWGKLLDGVTTLARMEPTFETLVIDTLNGAQYLLRKAIIESDFDNDPDRFDSYGKGWARMFEPWKIFLSMLDQLRHSRGMRIILLAHSAVNKIGNPDGDDYQSNTPELNEKWIWNQSNAYADNVLFANLEVVAIKKKGDSKTKAEKGDRRLLYVHSTASHFAKNRWGIRQPISMGNNGADAYANLMTAIKATKVKEQPKPEAPPSAEAAWNKRISAAKKFPVALNLFGELAEAATQSPDAFAPILLTWTRRCAELAGSDVDSLFMLKAKFAERPDLSSEAIAKIIAEAA